MAYEIGKLVKGTGIDCHKQFIDAVKTLAEANGWTTLIYDTTTDSSYRLMLQGEGLTGTEEIYIGFKTFQDDDYTDPYYNIGIYGFSGYVSGDDFEDQPDAFAVYTPANNFELTYFLSVNAQRILFCLKYLNVSYQHGYAGKFLPYCDSSEYSYPMFIGGNCNSSSDTYLTVTETAYFKNSNYRYRSVSGTWSYLSGTWPFSSSHFFSSNEFFETPLEGTYQLNPIILYNTANVFGQLDGIYAISGFQNKSENVIQVGGSSIIDQTDLTISEAIAAILAVSGRAFIVLKQGTNTKLYNEYAAIEMES